MRATQLSCFQIPDPQKLGEVINDCCGKPLHLDDFNAEIKMKRNIMSVAFGNMEIIEDLSKSIFSGV